MAEQTKPLPWNERINVLSINPDAATRDEIARMAADLTEAHTALALLEDQKWRPDTLLKAAICGILATALA